MTSFVLKIIALITMFIDHLGYAIYGKFSYLNYIGRIAFPIFAFQISEGFVHTKNIKKYFIRLLVFAIISQLPFMLFLSTFSKNIYELNIFFTLSFGLLAIFIFDKIINTNLTIFNKSIDKFIKLFLGLLITFFYWCYC
ncbi:MAG: TraX family protein [Clostridia bacterium]